jgi:hypothetical protein
MLFLIVALPSFANGDDINPYVYSTDSSPHGITYQKWTGEFWRWLLSLSASEHPRENYTPEKCANGQDGDVWFLEAPLSGEEERTCTIPAGKSILAAVLQGMCNTSDPALQNDEDIRKCATEGNDYGVISGSLDGVEIKNLDQYRTDSGFYDMTHVADNLYQLPEGGPYRAYTNGYFVFLEPLPPGEHDLHLTVSVANPINPQYNYAAEWTYHLIISEASTASTPALLQGTSSSGKFKVQVNWTSNDIGQDNTFDLKFIDATSGDEISNSKYSIMLFKGEEHLNESHREDQTAAQQTYTFDEVGSYTLRIENINGSGAEDGIDIPMQVTPEFPPVVMTVLLMVAMSASIIFASRIIKRNGFGT